MKSTFWIQHAPTEEGGDPVLRMQVGTLAIVVQDRHDLHRPFVQAGAALRE